MSGEPELSGTALRIYLELLQSGEMGVRELARELGLPPSTVHYHLNRLEDLGLVKKGEDGYTVAKRIKLKDYVFIGSRAFHRLLLYSAFFLGLSAGEALLTLQGGGLNPDRAAAILASLLSGLAFLHEYLRAR